MIKNFILEQMTLLNLHVNVDIAQRHQFIHFEQPVMKEKWCILIVNETLVKNAVIKLNFSLLIQFLFYQVNQNLC